MYSVVNFGFLIRNSMTRFLPITHCFVFQFSLLASLHLCYVDFCSIEIAGKPSMCSTFDPIVLTRGGDSTFGGFIEGDEKAKLYSLKMRYSLNSQRKVIKRKADPAI